MKRWLLVLFTFPLFAQCVAGSVLATSQQAYQDYLYQFGVYRQRYTDFKVAKNEYEKFHSLASQTTALEKTKILLAQRDQLLRSYLLVLNEKLNEDRGLSPTEKQLYQTLIRNEITFLEKHAALIPSIGSIEDAQEVSDELTSHSKVLQTSIRQILVGVSLGQLATLHQQYDVVLGHAQTLVATYGTVFPNQKQADLNRWLLYITNKRQLYQQKIDAISQASSQLSPNDANDLDRRFTEFIQGAAEARQYLAEGASYMNELVTALKYRQ